MHPSPPLVFWRTAHLRLQLDTEVQALLVERDISAPPFAANMVAELPPYPTPEKPWIPPADEVARRKDLRTSHRIFSIDPLGSQVRLILRALWTRLSRTGQDIDDALSARVLANGNIEVGVHIADVSQFVLPDTLLDIEARSRSTTVYVHRTTPHTISTRNQPLCLTPASATSPIAA